MPPPETEFGPDINTFLSPNPFIDSASSDEFLFPNNQPNRRGTFNRDIKKRVRDQQRQRCAICGVRCRGHEKKEPEMQIHHIIPVSMGGDNSRKNAIGLCADNCHPLFDRMAIEQGLTVFDEMKRRGIVYAPMRGHKRK